MKIILLLLALIMPVTADTAGLILGPYFQLAELIASTDEWQSLTDTDNVTDALESIAFPEYIDFEAPQQGAITVPLCVLSNPWDMATEFYGVQDNQGRVDHGQLLWQMFLKTESDPANALRNFIHHQELLLEQMTALSGMAKPAGAGWYIKTNGFQLAFSPGRVPISNLQCLVRGEDGTKPQSVTTGAFVINWIRS